MPDTTTAEHPSRPLDLASPPATRLARPRWLDVRLVVGVLLVLGSVLLGTRVVAGADDTTAVLVVQSDLQAGVRLSPDDVGERRVRLDAGLDRYLAAGSPVSGYVLTRPVGEGELLPVAAIAPADEAAAAGGLRWVTIAVPAEERPEGLSSGDLVDVWIAPAAGVDSAAATAAAPLATEVAVERVTGSSAGLGGARESTVTLAVTAEGQARPLDEIVGTLVAAARDGRVYLTVLPGRDD